MSDLYKELQSLVARRRYAYDANERRYIDDCIRNIEDRMKQEGTYTGGLTTYAIDPGRMADMQARALDKMKWVWTDGGNVRMEPEQPSKGKALAAAMESIKELTATLEQIKEEPLILYRIDRLSKDKKHCFVKKGDTDLRIKTVPKLIAGDEVLLHPKTFQIVEHLGRPPLEVSRFSPGKPPPWNPSRN